MSTEQVGHGSGESGQHGYRWQYDYEKNLPQWATADIAAMLEWFADGDFDHEFHAVLKEAARRLRSYQLEAGPIRLGMCRICERRTAGVTICRYCDRMMKHLDGVLQHHRDRLAEKRDEADRRYGLHGSEFTRGKAAAYADALEAFPVKGADPEQESSHD